MKRISGQVGLCQQDLCQQDLCQEGLSLIEVLIAICLLSLGALAAGITISVSQKLKIDANVKAKTNIGFYSKQESCQRRAC